MIKQLKKNKFDNVFIHTGLPKTGSSFLQSALESIELQKGFSDVTYPVLNKVDEFQFIRSGNGLEIAKLLERTLTPEFDELLLIKTFNELLDKSLNKRSLLISSEAFSSAAPERFAVFKQMLSEVCDNISIIVYVRPFAPWAWSLYNQGLKRHNFKMSFEEWASQNLLGDFNQLIDSLFRFDVNIIPLPYDRVDLLSFLLDTISEDKNIAELVPNVVVNRSLSEIENNILKISNNVFNDSRVSIVISDMLIKEMPFKDTMAVSTEVASQSEMFLPKIDDCLDKYDHKVSHKIKEFLHRKFDIKDLSEIKTYEKNDVHEAMTLTFKALLNIFSKSDVRISKLLECVEALKQDDSGFDPIHYLLLNFDVLDSSLGPYEHYKRFGKKEERSAKLCE
jgi:hypothetical protein